MCINRRKYECANDVKKIWWVSKTLINSIYIEEFEKYVGMRYELLMFGMAVQCVNHHTTASLNISEEIGLYVFN